MSSKALLWLRTQHPRNQKGQIDPTMKLVLYALADRDNQKNEKNQVWSSQEDIRQLTGLARSTVAAKLKDLEVAGYIGREHRTWESGPRRGQRTTDIITLRLDKEPDPPIEAREQPDALKRANEERSSARYVRNPEQAAEILRAMISKWESELPAEYSELGPWWPKGSESERGIVRVDPGSGQVIERLGKFTNADRDPKRRRPSEMWTSEDIVDEVLDRIYWLGVDSPEWEHKVWTALQDFHHSLDVFMPGLECAVIFRTFDSLAFLEIVSEDVGSGMTMLIEAIDAAYRDSETQRANA